MSAIQTILDRMMNEAAFAEAVFSDPATALAGYDLSENELSKFQAITREDFAAFAAVSPEDRRSFGLSNNNVLWGNYYYLDMGG